MSEEKIAENFDFSQIKIKKEKIDEEIEKKLLPYNFSDQNSNKINNDNNIDDKSIIKPVKSSNEILAELFRVFNAEPPKELLDDKNLVKKYKLKSQKRKKRKKSKNYEDENISESSLKSSNSKHKKKKHKKRKNESNNNEKRSEEKKSHKRKATKTSDFEISDLEVDETTQFSPNLNTVNDEQSFDLSKVKIEKIIKEEKIEKKTEEKKEKDVIKVKTELVDSDISLSDEETYLEQKKRETRSRTSFFRSSDRKYERDRYENNRNYYKHSSDRYSDRDRYRRRSKDRDRYRTRSRSRSPRSDLGIDKKRLLEIARKNAINMFKSGSLPGCAGMTEEIKDKVLLKMRYGGKTVQDLTDFCRKLSNGENVNDLSELSSDEDSEHDKDGNKKVFHHPFVIKEREPIVLHIRNAIPIAPKSADQAKAILMQFPVSSGQEHRNTEEWIPVSAKPETKTQTIGPVLPKPTVAKNVFHKPLPTEEQQPAFRPLNSSPKEVEPTLPPISKPIVNNDAVPISVPEKSTPFVPLIPEYSLPPPSLLPPPLPPLLPSIGNGQLVPPSLPISVPPPVAIPAPAPAPAVSVFPAMNPSTVDVSTIISKRLNAMRRLQDNPGDTEAISMMYNSQEEMSSWASSKFTPGQFTGSTGANVLSAKELTSGFQAWVKKDQLTSTAPVTGGMGMHLLKKMGWKPGEGLGREKNGSLQPLLLDVKLDKRGLEANDENTDNCLRQNLNKRKRAGTIAQSIVSLESKHPVCLLNELAAKKKWILPVYELAHDEGPAHNKTFLFQIILNGCTYKPQIGSNTKKDAKFEAAKFCLQQIGILPVV